MREHETDNHKLEGITIADGVDVQLDCAVVNGTNDVTALVKAGYKESAEIAIVDVSEKPAASSNSEGIYSGHIKSASEAMGVGDSEAEETPEVYYVLIIAAAVVLIGAAIVGTVIILEKQVLID